jgi:RNA polymerase sigma factor (sigma-70 family)
MSIRPDAIEPAIGRSSRRLSAADRRFLEEDTTRRIRPVLSRFFEVGRGPTSGKEPRDVRSASRVRFSVDPWGHAGSLDVCWVLPPITHAVNTFRAAVNLHCRGNACRMSARSSSFRKRNGVLPFTADERHEGDTMSPFSDSQTSLTLMEMLREQPQNALAWDRFVRRYHPKIYGWCKAWGLQEADAEDVAQDVLAKLTQKMASFQYDQSRCFRAWLKTITQRVLSDLIANRKRSLGGPAIRWLETHDARADLERRIEEIFNRELLELAMSRVRARVAASTWEAFRLMALEDCTGAEASQSLGMPIASVFVAKHRVQKMLKEEIRRLDSLVEE